LLFTCIYIAAFWHRPCDYVPKDKFWEVLMIRPVLDTQNPTESDPKTNPPKIQPATSVAWNATVDKPASSTSSASAKPDGQVLALDVRYDVGRVVSPANVPLRFVPAKQGPASGPDDGSPQRAKNGADAAKNLLSKNNPYFYAHILYQTDRDYDPEVAKAEAFAATLSDYEQKGDNANIALLLQKLGPEEAAKLLAKAGKLEGPQVNSSGTVYAQDQKGVDQVLAKALQAPGVQLGDVSQQGTLAHNLLQQAAQPGSNALSIRGILSAAGASPQMDALKNEFHNGSPERAMNGADAARDLLNRANFYDHRLFKDDPSYNAEDARAQAFAATLSDYEQRGDNANIAALMRTLGPDEAAKLMARAGKLQGQQKNGGGTVYAQDQAGVAQVLAKALSSPGVQLGSGTQRGTLAYSLLQQATQSGTSASSVAGILNASPTSKDTEALKQQLLNDILVNGKAQGTSFDQANYANAAHMLINNDPALLTQHPDGIGVQHVFASNGVPVPEGDARFLPISSIDTDLYGLDRNGTPKGPGNPVKGSIKPTTMNEIQGYLEGKYTKGESSSQLLANMMNVLGPDRTYAVLSQLPQAEMFEHWKQLDFEGSLKTLTESGQFTADDAKALSDAQVKFATAETGSGVNTTPNAVGSVGRMIASLPSDPNGTAVKTAYAEECISNVQKLSQQIASGNYSGQALRTLNSMADNASKVISNSPIDVKIDLFTKLHATATQFTNMGKDDEANALNAYAAGLLDAGSPDGKAQIAQTLRNLDGAGAVNVGANGTIAPGSPLAQFLRSALRGQAEFGFAGLSDLAPNGTMPNDVTQLLNGITASGDKQLMAGTLDVVMQWTMNNPQQSQVLAAQDNRNGSPGYREALTHMLDASFNEFISLAPGDANAKLVKNMQDQTLADLQALSVVAMGPPYDGKVAGDFANVVGRHSVEFAAYATGAKDPVLDNLFKGIGDQADGTQRHASALIFGQIMNAFAEGLNEEEASAKAQAGKADIASAINQLQERIVTDYLRGAGTTLLFFSTPVGFVAGKATEVALSMAGRFFLGAGSWGTLFLDQGQLGDLVNEGQAVQAVSQGLKAADLAPSQGMRQLYDGWVTKVSQLPGKGDAGDENFETLESLYTGASYAAAPMIKNAFNDFYDKYDPMGYTRDQTGQNPPVVTG
jgi:hypothetical protein